MKAMVLKAICRMDECQEPLELMEMPEPSIENREILVRISACGVCHTELDEIEGRVPPAQLPVVPGHQVIGRVQATGRDAGKFRPGDRVGVSWIYSACGNCRFCEEENENLCRDFKATGKDAHGGYAEYMKVHESYAYPVPDGFSDSEAAPLLCAGAIGYRSLRLTGLKNGQNLGLSGFGASSHLVLKMARHRYPDTPVFVFARSAQEREFALELGAVWAGDTHERSPEELSAVIDTTPVWKPVVEALRNLEPGGRLVINAIGKEDIDKAYLQNLEYPAHLWMEKEIKSVANVARRDVSEFLALAGRIDIRPAVQEYDLRDANTALYDLRSKGVRGAKVLVC